MHQQVQDLDREEVVNPSGTVGASPPSPLVALAALLWCVVQPWTEGHALLGPREAKWVHQAREWFSLSLQQQLQNPKREN